MIKTDKKLPKIYLTYYNLLIAQDYWQAHYQILSIIFLKEFIELNVNEHNDKKCEICGIKQKYCNCFLEYINFKDDLIEYKHLRCNKNYQQTFDEKLNKQFLNAYTFSITISLYHYHEKVFILMNILMIGENSMNDCRLKRKIFTVT